MKKNLILNILRTAFFIVFVLLLTITIINPKKTQTNILKAIISDYQNDEILIDLSQKYSGRLNVIIESEDLQKIAKVKTEFLAKTDKDAFKKDFSSSDQLEEFINTYKYFNANLLSPSTREKIEQGNTEEVKLESIERLYNPLSINIIPLEEDPFLLFNNYIEHLPSSQTQIPVENNGIFYEIINLNLKNNIALSPSLLNTEIKKIVELSKDLEQKNQGVKIHLAGSPIHTYYASSKSMTEINVICVLSLLFITILCKLYFKTLKILIPIFISLTLGMLYGYFVTSLFFDSIHILTFVFSTTLIGICVDYSLHYFAHNKDLKNIIKSLSVSMITTVCAFLMLLFSQIELLKQIAIFTATGLFSVYSFVVLFYPVICKNLSVDETNSSFIELIFSSQINKKVKITFALICVLTMLIGLSTIKFNDDIKDMYKPPKNLIESEKLYSQVSNNTSTTGFIIITDSDMQKILEKEEKITKNIPEDKYISLSRFLPSKKMQLKNQRLKHYLYTKEINNYATFLPESKRNKIINSKPRPGFLTEKRIPDEIKENFIISDNQSIIFVKEMDNEWFNKISQIDGIRYIELKKEISSKVKTCRENCIKIFLPAILVLYIILSCLYNPINAFKITAPSIIGGLFTIGILSIFQVDINLFHILALFLIIGFSLDYSIFRFSSNQSSIQTNSAVLISCATTVFSFLLLACTSFKLISSLGLILGLGLINSYILSLLLIKQKEI